MIPCPFSDMDRASANAKAFVLGDVEALPELSFVQNKRIFAG